MIRSPTPNVVTSMQDGGRTAVILFTGDSRREERRKRLPRRLLSTMHAGIARIAGGACDLFVCGDAHRLPFVRGTFAAEGSLGEQVTRVVDAVLVRGYANVMLLAGDVVGFRERHLAEALRLLSESARRAVIGRCRDGGFYLAAFNSKARIDWDALPWFGATVAVDLEMRLAADGFAVAQLDMLEDIDDIADARRILPSLPPAIPGCAVATFLPVLDPSYAPLYRRPPPRSPALLPRDP